MLIPLNNLKHVYQYILSNALEFDGKGCTIYIFVSNDADSLASLKILSTLLKSDEVQFVTIPVFSTSHITEQMRKLGDKSDSEYATYARSLVFINCGGNIDMTQQLIYQQRKEVKMYMLDSHRPYHHHNINEDLNRVFVIHDGCKSFEDYPSKEDDQIKEQFGGSDQGSEEEDSDYDSEAENSEQQEAKRELEELKDREDGEDGADGDDEVDLAQK